MCLYTVLLGNKRIVDILSRGFGFLIGEVLIYERWKGMGLREIFV